MITVIRDARPIAKKDYSCDACDYILKNGIDGNNYPISELRKIVKAKMNGYKILKGERYVMQVNKLDGDFYVFRAIPEMHELCLKYELYEY